jgi:hypothetical protein
MNQIQIHQRPDLKNKINNFLNKSNFCEQGQNGRIAGPSYVRFSLVFLKCTSKKKSFAPIYFLTTTDAFLNKEII